MPCLCLLLLILFRRSRVIFYTFNVCLFFTQRNARTAAGDIGGGSPPDFERVEDW